MHVQYIHTYIDILRTYFLHTYIHVKFVCGLHSTTIERPRGRGREGGGESGEGTEGGWGERVGR